MNIDKIEAGRELDALVAEKVMGWTDCDVKEDCEWWQSYEHNKWRKFCVKYGMGAPPETRPGFGMRTIIPPYSVAITAAWEVVEKLDSGHTSIEIANYTESYENDISKWHCQFIVGDDFGTANGDTLPLAICRAALKAIQNER